MHVAGGLRVTVVYVTEQEVIMYTPALSEKTVKTLYRMKRFYKKPITEIAEEMIKKSMHTFDKEQICRVCVSESNNDCGNCSLADEKKGGDE